MIDRYLQQSWIPPGPAAIILGVLTLLLIISYVWSIRVSPNSATATSWLHRFGSLVMVLTGPALVLFGMSILLFAFGRPDAIVLRSYAMPDSEVSSTPACFDADFRVLQAVDSIPPSECDPVAFKPLSRIIDAGPLVEKALDLFVLNNPLQPAQLGSRNDATIGRIKSVVIDVLSSMEPPLRLMAPPAPDIAKIRQLQAKVPRWIILSIETNIIEGLTLLRNVHNIAVERHVANSDPQDGPWELLRNRLSPGIGAKQPVMHLTRGSPISPDAFVSFFGLPWLQQTASGTIIYAMLLKGPRQADASLRLRSSDGIEIPLACGSNLRDCVSAYDRWSNGTTRLAVLKTAGELPAGTLVLELAIKDTGEVRTSAVEDRSAPQTILAVGDSDLLDTLGCLDRARLKTALAPLASSSDGTAQIRRGPTNTASVVIERVSGRLWIYPADIDAVTLADLKGNARSVPGTVIGIDEPLAGLWLFPYLVRGDGLAPGAGQMLATPLVAMRSSGSPARWDTDPAAGLSAPTSLWIPRFDARPALFAYAMDNYVRYGQRVSPSSALPVGWRIDLATGRKGGGSAVVWVFQLDLAQQGLLLDAGCWPVSDRAAPEPAYDAARFVPFWSTMIEALRTSAEKGTDAAILTAVSDSQPIPALLDDATRRQVQMRQARYGMLFVVAGMLIHAMLMVWFRFSIASRSGTIIQ